MKHLQLFYRAFREYKEKLANDDVHQRMMSDLEGDVNAKEAYQGRMCRCSWDEEWIDAIESGLPYVERALEEQRRFIESNEEIKRIDQAKKTTVESIRHLAQHSNLISNIQGEDIVPDRVLVVERDDNYAIYENRFLYTLIIRLEQFLEERYRAIMGLDESEAFSYTTTRTTAYNRTHMEATISLNYERKAERIRHDVATAEMTNAEKLAELRRRVSMLRMAPLMKKLKGVIPVQSPIVRTNVFKKNTNFKKALELFEFLDRYRKPGYEAVIDTPDASSFTPDVRTNVCELIALQQFVGQIGGSLELTRQLEENFQYENELAEQERIRQEEERERKVLERIEAARQEEIAIREIEIAKREEIIAQKNRELKIADEQHEADTKRIVELNSELEQTVKELRETRSELEQTKTERDRALQDIQNLKEQLETTRREAAELLETTRKELEDQLDTLRMESEKQAMELRQTKNLLETAQRDLDSSREENGRLNEQLLQRQEELRRSIQERDEAEREKKQVQDSMEQLRKVSERSIHQLEQENEKLRNALEREKEETKQLEWKKKEADKEAAALQKENNHLKSETDRLEIVYRKQREETERLERKLAELKVERTDLEQAGKTETDETASMIPEKTEKSFWSRLFGR